MSTASVVDESELLDAVFSALSDPTRRAILERLRAGEASVGELSEPFAMSQPAVSKHLRVLENAGLISRSQIATSRYSRLDARPLKEATQWMQSYRRFWAASFDRLDDALARHLDEHPEERRHPAAARPAEGETTTEPTERNAS